MRCPICKKQVDNSPANEFRPFCSDRCRTIDLGAWAGGSYKIEGEKVNDHEHPDDRPKKQLH